MKSVLILQKKPGLIIPKAYIEKVASQYKSGFGWAAGDGKCVDWSFSPSDKANLVDDMMDVQDIFKDVDAAFVYINSDTSLLEQDFQPYELIRDKDKGTQLVALLTGEYLGFNNAEKSHGPEYDVVHEFLDPKCKELFQVQRESLGKTLEQMQGPSFRRDLQNVLVPSGQITLVGADQKIISFRKGMDVEEHEWGNASHKLGDEGTKVDLKPAAEVVSKPMSAKERLAKMKAERSGTPTSVPVVEPPQKKEEPEKKAEPQSTMVMVPDKLHGRMRKKWFKRHFSTLPPDWETCKGLPFNLLRADSELRKIKTFAELPGANSEPAPAEPEKEQPQTEEAPAQTPEPVKEGVTTDVPPLVFPGHQKEIVELLDKMTKEHGLNEPAQVTALADKYDSFTKQINLKGGLSTIMRCKMATLRKLCSGYPQGAATLILELCSELAKSRPDLLKVVEEKKEEDAKPLSAKERLAQMKAKRVAM